MIEITEIKAFYFANSPCVPGTGFLYLFGYNTSTRLITFVTFLWCVKKNMQNIFYME